MLKVNNPSKWRNTKKAKLKLCSFIVFSVLLSVTVMLKINNPSKSRNTGEGKVLPMLI